MPHWYLKAIPQKILSLLPGGKALHHLLQRRFMGSLEITDFFLEDRLSHVGRHLKAWRSLGDKDKAPVCLEIGTGWYPVVPLGLALCGAARVYSVDVNHYTSEELQQRLFQALIVAAEQKLLQTYLPDIESDKWKIFQEGIRAGLSSTELYAKLNIHLIKGEAATLPAMPEEIDLIHSNNTFEHIPSEELPSLLLAIRDRLAAGGLSSHYIDLTDHYSYFDSRLSPLNYLRFSASQWHWIENSFQSQNRLRVNQWWELMAKAGLPVLWQENESGESKDLAKLPLASPFKEMRDEEMLVRYTHLVSQKQKTRKN